MFRKAKIYWDLFRMEGFHSFASKAPWAITGSPILLSGKSQNALNPEAPRPIGKQVDSDIALDIRYNSQVQMEYDKHPAI